MSCKQGKINMAVESSAVGKLVVARSKFMLDEMRSNLTRNSD